MWFAFEAKKMKTIQSDKTRKQIQESAEEIFSVMEKRESPENVQRIRDAFAFADDWYICVGSFKNEKNAKVRNGYFHKTGLA